MTHAMLALMLRLVGTVVLITGTAIAVSALWPLVVGFGALLFLEGLLMERDL